jgi:hypothetical protein
MKTSADCAQVHVFLLGVKDLMDDDYSETNRVYIDAYATLPGGTDYDAMYKSAKVADRMLGIDCKADESQTRKMEKMVSGLSTMRLRQQFNSSRLYGPLCVKTDEIVEIDVIETYVKSLSVAGLRQFMKDAHLYPDERDRKL